MHPATPLDLNGSSLTPARVEGQQNYDGSVFPRVLSGQTLVDEGSFWSWLSESRHAILNQASLDGAILFRDCPIRDVEAFDRFVTSLGLGNFPYEKTLSNAVRINRTPRVFSANEAPPEVQIFFHHEMAQTPLYPQWILFYCEQPAARGGATPLCRSDILYQRLQQERPEFTSKCEAIGLRYSNVMPGDNDAQSGMGRSWRSTLGTESREGAEARLDELGYQWQWLDDDCLRVTSPPLPAVMQVPTGAKSFFNQLIAAYSGWKDERNDPTKAICHGDGSALDGEAVQKAIELAEELAFDHQWQAGDAVLVDNRLVMHARRPFEGTRKVLASLGNMQTQTFTPAV